MSIGIDILQKASDELKREKDLVREWKFMIFDLAELPKDHSKWLRHQLKEVGTDEETIERLIKDEEDGTVWLSRKGLRYPHQYQVFIYNHAMKSSEDWPDMWHLSIKRVDRKPINDWRVMQAIKNALVGPEHEGVELYPNENRLVDGANQYHLFVMKDSRLTFPFGFNDGRHVTEEGMMGSTQRPLNEPAT